jgi:hypothetical protein
MSGPRSVACAWSAALAALAATGCGGGDPPLAYGTHVDATQFTTDAPWTRFAVPQLEGVTVMLPAAPEQSGAFGNDYYVVKDAEGCRRATVSVVDPHDRLRDAQRLEARCTTDAEATERRTIDGQSACVVTHPVSAVDRAAADRGEPACRLHTLFAMAEGLVVSVAYSAPLDAPDGERAVRERLFGAFRLADPATLNPPAPASP